MGKLSLISSVFLAVMVTSAFAGTNTTTRGSSATTTVNPVTEKVFQNATSNETALATSMSCNPSAIVPPGILPFVLLPNGTYCNLATLNYTTFARFVAVPQQFTPRIMPAPYGACNGDPARPYMVLVSTIGIAPQTTTKCLILYLVTQPRPTTTAAATTRGIPSTSRTTVGVTRTTTRAADTSPRSTANPRSSSVTGRVSTQAAAITTRTWQTSARSGFSTTQSMGSTTKATNMLQTTHQRTGGSLSTAKPAISSTKPVTVLSTVKPATTQKAEPSTQRAVPTTQKAAATTQKAAASANPKTTVAVATTKQTAVTDKLTAKPTTQETTSAVAETKLNDDNEDSSSDDSSTAVPVIKSLADLSNVEKAKLPVGDSALADMLSATANVIIPSAGSAWSECSATCGFGVRSRMLTDGKIEQKSCQSTTAPKCPGTAEELRWGVNFYFRPPITFDKYLEVRNSVKEEISKKLTRNCGINAANFVKCCPSYTFKSSPPADIRYVKASEIIDSNFGSNVKAFQVTLRIYTEATERFCSVGGQLANVRRKKRATSQGMSQSDFQQMLADAALFESIAQVTGGSWTFATCLPSDGACSGDNTDTQTMQPPSVFEQNKTAIIGGICGGVALIILITILCCCLRPCCKNPRQPASDKQYEKVPRHGSAGRYPTLPPMRVAPEVSDYQRKAQLGIGDESRPRPPQNVHAAADQEIAKTAAQTINIQITK